MNPDSAMSCQAVIARYPLDCQPTRIETLGAAGGFSGAEFWRLMAPRGLLCLRRWPREHPSRERLTEIHGVLARVGRRGVQFVPRPLPTRDGSTFVEHAGHLWELAPWLSGTADYHRTPTPRRLTAAMEALATFHLAAAEIHDQGAAPGIAQRLDRLRALRAGGLTVLRQAVAEQRARWPELAQRAPRLLDQAQAAAPAVEQSLAELAPHSFPLQPCLRDIWHDHVLFEGDRVTGLIDFGAMRVDHVATDVARLLGSLVRDDDANWETGLAAYAAVRPLSTLEGRLVWAFDESSVLMSGLSWLEWIFRDGRQFDAPAVILSRVDENLERLAALMVRRARLAHCPSSRLTCRPRAKSLHRPA